MDCEQVLEWVRSEATDAELKRIKSALKLRDSAYRLLFSVGDTVQIGNNVSPKYLRGQLATIERIERTKVYLQFHQPDHAGRFARGCHVPYELITKV